MGTIENNKLIAEFMGDKSADTQEQYDEFVENGFKSNTWHTNELCYDASWDWLMPVVEKIEKTSWVSNDLLATWTEQPFNVHIKTSDTEIEIDGIHKSSKVYQSSPFNYGTKDIKGKSKLELTYLICVNFIQWYNQNKQA